MKIVTYNVNGLRPRIVPYRSLHGLLSSLDADIICFQETKLTRQELTAEIAIVEGYEAFFSCTRTLEKGRVRYSGVATFCRTETFTQCTSCVVPIAADEGFTGLLHVSKEGKVEGGRSRVGYYDEVLNMDTISREELFNLDREGRCIVTDHGSFVLFNLYGPHVQCGDTERLDFKLKFYRALQCRWESLLKKGRRIVVVGDLNITPFRIDSCDPGPEFNLNPCRKWLQSLLDTNGGQFSDLFRVVHGNRRDAYTCWSQVSGAEEFNFGTRIDLILAAGPCVHATRHDARHGFACCEVDDCDIMVKFKRFKEDSLPRWAHGRNLKLEGSDHVPVYVVLKQQPDVEAHDVPSLAVRFLPHLRGQQKIACLLQRNGIAMVRNDLEKEAWDNVYPNTSSASSTPTLSNAERSNMIEENDEGSQVVKTYKSTLSTAVNMVSSRSCCSKKSTSALKTHALQRFKKKEGCQTTLRSFFSAGSRNEASSQQICSSIESSKSRGAQVSTSLAVEDNVKASRKACTTASDMQESLVVDVDESLIACTSGHEGGCQTKKDVEDVWFGLDSKYVKAEAEWKQLQDMLARGNPVCKGHGEPCVVRIVKKAGSNKGRGFYVCARAKGPASNLEARCHHFEWVSKSWKR